MEERSWLEGTISVKAAIEARRRHIFNVYLREGTKFRKRKHLQRLQQLALADNIPVHWMPEDFFAANARGGSHGGVLAEVGPRQLATLIDLCAVDRPGFVAMLDGIEDPFNFGQGVRALYSAGVDGVVLRPRNWMHATAVVARSSAGASELLPIAVVAEISEAVDFFRQRDYQIVCTGERGEMTIYEADFRQSLLLLLGGEKRGITRSFLAEADMVLRIPYGRQYPYALGTAMSAAVVAFEVLRQRTSGLPDSDKEEKSS